MLALSSEQIVSGGMLLVLLIAVAGDPKCRKWVSEHRGRLFACVTASGSLYVVSNVLVRVQRKLDVGPDGAYWTAIVCLNIVLLVVVWCSWPDGVNASQIGSSNKDD